jgi:hypothetical protein
MTSLYISIYDIICYNNMYVHNVCTILEVLNSNSNGVSLKYEISLFCMYVYDRNEFMYSRTSAVQPTLIISTLLLYAIIL